jgi:pyruvate dehydrogenase E2 component (dihydrolipoamide acetyltransferase)
MREIVMPKSSMTMTEGDLVAWIVDAGARVREGDPIAEIMTDKVEMEVEAPSDGRVEILVEAGATVPVGTPIGVILGEGEKPPAPSERPAVEGTAEPPSTNGRGTPAKLRASPAARAMAKKNDIDLGALTGSGPRGRITTDDVAQAAQERPPHSTETVNGEPAPGGRTPATERVAGEGRVPAQTAAGVLSRERPRGIRGAMARRMAEAASIPQFTLFSDISFAAAERARRQLSDTWKMRVGVNELIVHATARALNDHPHLNAHFVEGEIVRFSRVDLGVAVATEEGLVVPVLKDAGALDLKTTTERLSELVAVARLARLKPEELRGATFTLTNLGPFGIDVFQPVIDPPQVAILSVGRQRGDAGRTITMGVAGDHRAVDGVQAARFLARLRELLERPDKELRL